MKYTIIAIICIVLFGCLLTMPYGYYQFVRMVLLAGFGWLTYIEYKDKRHTLTGVYVVLALLFQPFEKIHFDRQTWNVIDIIVAAGLAIWAIVDFVISKQYRKRMPY